MPGSHKSWAAAPSQLGGVGSPALAPSPTSSESPHSHSQSATPTSSTFHTPTVAIAMRPGLAPGKSEPGLSSNKMSMASVLTPAPQPGPAKGPVSMTSKEWVIPPRPKPGRKPATDTPPTKRKAQNRAAQRAFRERRAARVGELEEHLDEEKAEHERIQGELKQRIQNLEVETQTLRTRCQVLENMLERERLERRRCSDEASQASSSHPGSTSISSATISSPHGITALSGVGAGPYQPQPSSAGSYAERHSITSTASGSALRVSISQIISPPDEVSQEGIDLTCGGSCHTGGPCSCAEKVLDSVVPLCGKCSLGTKCECLEAALNAPLATMGASSDLKRRLRSASPCSVAPDEKRPRADTALETDFTALFASKKQPPPPLPPAPEATIVPESYLPLPSQPQAIPPRESCGFCNEGSYCVCADAMLPPAVTAAPAPAIMAPTTGPTSQVRTPPPSENDVVPPPLEVTATGAIKLPGLSSLRYGRRNAGDASTRAPTIGSSCGPGGPGTCAQCLADPKSGLFCRSLAANLEKVGSGSSGGCCGGGGAAGGCCKKQPARTLRPAPRGQDVMNVTVSCADAYKTLSSHRHFDEAADEIGTWLPKLRAAPRPQTDQSGNGNQAAPRPAMEVEAASIMSVLKGFDVRFGT